MTSKTKSKPANIKTKPDKTKKIKVVSGNLIDVYNLAGKLIGQEKAPEKYFSAKDNPKLVAQAIRVYQANTAKNTASTKSRGQVSGSTRKLHRQKGTGRSRQGSVKAPHRVGGGVAFGPKPLNINLRLPKKMRQKALAVILTAKLNQKSIIAIDNLDKLEPKTKKLNLLFQKLPLSGRKLLVLNAKSQNVKLAARNLKECQYVSVESLNAYQIYQNGNIIFSKNALLKLAGL